MDIFVTQPFDSKLNLHYFQKFDNAAKFVIDEMKKIFEVKGNHVVNCFIEKIDDSHWCGTF